ncbi:MAG: amidohydrolase [Rhodospirillales bacterium]
MISDGGKSLPASLVLHNGKVATVDQSDRIVEAIAINDDKIQMVGSNNEIKQLIGPNTQIFDLKGKTVVPGLIDGHAHMDREGLKSALPSMAGVKSIDDILQVIEGEVKSKAPGEWVVTMPIGDLPSFENVPDCLKEGRFPNRFDLDKVSPNNPVYIKSIWGYWREALPLVSVANSEALRLAGIDRNTKPPASSVEIEFDSDSGEPTGIFREHNKMPVVEFSLMAVAPSFDVATRTDALLKSMQIYNSYGTTSVVEGHGASADLISAYQNINKGDGQTVRANLAFSPAWHTVSNADVGEMISSWAKWLAGKGIGDEWLRVQGFYSEADDSEESRIRQSGGNQTGWAGFNYGSAVPTDKLKPLLIEAARNGIRTVAVLPYMLDVFRDVNKEASIEGQRWVFGHITTLTTDEIAAIRDLGLSVTTHTSGFLYKRGLQKLNDIGAERENEIVPLRSLLDAGVPVSLATDNVPVSMLFCAWHAIARVCRDTDQKIAPDQALTREEALRCMTMAGAHLTFEEEIKGSLEPGKLADLVVLSDDILTCEEDRIQHIVSDLTVVGGKVVYERNKDQK